MTSQQLLGLYHRALKEKDPIRMQPIHPFPARMAPDTVARWLDDLPKGSRILDPMCGSGVVIRQSALRGHNVQGFDIDPLAVLMSRVWTRKGSHRQLPEAAKDLVHRARLLKRHKHTSLEWIKKCAETREFIEYWFSEPQRSDLSRLARAIQSARGLEKDWICDCFSLALSRIIVTKYAGASLAWDVSHSRPHKKKIENDFDVFEGFLKSIDRLTALLDGDPLSSRGVVRQGDCRKLTSLKSASVDAVITSPPYLNAIDYLRGHKLALVWLGYTIPFLRSIRSGAVGTERTGARSMSGEMSALEKRVTSIRRLPQRQRLIVHKYAHDARQFMQEMRRVLVKDGLMVLVLGDCNLRNVPVYNSRIFKTIAEEHGFLLEDERKRPLREDRRYLPINSSNDALSSRMRFEVIQSYRLTESA
jgi:SAM-dependent methyltransferase